MSAYDTKIVYYYSEKPILWWNDEKVNLVLFLTSGGYQESFAQIYNLLFDLLMDQNTYEDMIRCDTFDKLISFIIGNI